MATFVIILGLLAIAAGVVFVSMKSGKIKDENNNNIPDAIEEKIEEVKEVAAKVKKVAKKAEAVAKTVVVEKKAKKPAAKKTK